MDEEHISLPVPVSPCDILVTKLLSDFSLDLTTNSHAFEARKTCSERGATWRVRDEGNFLDDPCFV